MAELRITLVRSMIGCTERQRATVAALGLRKINQKVVKEDTLVVRGMVAKVSHLLKVD